MSWVEEANIGLEESQGRSVPWKAKQYRFWRTFLGFKEDKNLG